MRKTITPCNKTDAGGILAELALSIALLITLVGGAIDISMQIARYGELIEVVKTVARMATEIPADGTDAASVEAAATDAVDNINAYLASKGLNPEEFQIQFLASPKQLTKVSELRGMSNTTALITVAIKRKANLMFFPSDFLFDSCVKSTYLWENVPNLNSDYIHNAEVDLGCV